MNQVVNKAPAGPVTISNKWANVAKDNDDLSQGVALSFPILAIGTNQWVVRWKAEDRLVTIPGTEYPAPFVDVVMLKAQKEMSRVFYAGGYVQGVRGKKPDCWSSNGVRPDETVAVPVNPVCATCPNSAWGSGASPAAPKAQACQQRRRTVVVPYAPGIDLTNEAEGGPMLLSVPPGSLTNLVRYKEALSEMELADGSKGMPYQACVTRLSYEPLLKYSKVVFQYQKPLDDAESDAVIALAGSEAVGRILNSKINIDGGEADADGGVASDNAPTSQVQQGIPPKPATGAPLKQPTAQVHPLHQPKVGGHPVNTSPNPSAAINEAVASPAAPPPSARPVVIQAKAAVQPAPPAPKMIVAPVDDETVDEAPQAPTGSPADKLTGMFETLMKND